MTYDNHQGGTPCVMFGRRGFLLGAVASFAPFVTACQTTTTSTGRPQIPADQGPNPEKPVTVLYIRSSSCPYCLRWERGVEPRWLASPERAAVTYRVLDFPHFRNISGDKFWPVDVRWVRDQENLTRGTPRFIVFRDREILASGFGTESWSREVLPAIRRAIA